MPRLFPTLLACLITASAVAAPIKVLVVSDSAEVRDALPALIKKGGAEVEVAPALAGDALQKADVLVIAGGAAPREALESFAKRGGGIVALGSGVASGEASWWKPLIGGAWTAQSQKFANKLMLFTLTDSHPITHAATPFDLDDETTYDLDREDSINVLASAFTSKVTSKKKDERSPERANRANVYDLQPQMWSYEGADQHRAFVLLQDTPASLRHPSIRTFILRGIAWAAKHENVDELCSKEDLATLRYPVGGARLAADTVKTFDLMPGFKASAIASEPLITKPIAMQWDARGRLWIAETPEYPNGRRPLVTESWKETGVLEPGKYDRPARDRISILSDPNANGVFTKKTVYYEGLELVTGFCLYGDGVIAVHQPDIVFIHGEGAAQKVERLYTGFTPGDTHFVANHFIVAPDGWIYADTGSGPDVVSVSHPEVKTRLGSGLFRFKPDGSAIEQVSSKGGNSFGGEVMSNGELLFGQATSGNPVQHVVLPEWILNKGKVGKAVSAESVIKGRKVIRPDMPDRAPFMQIDVVGGYSAACASTVYEGGAWPSEWTNSVFCTEPILDIIHCEKLVPAGPTFTGEMIPTDREWLRSHDFWFFPNDVEFGPDGAMYVLDFYCPVVAHSDTRGPQHSKAGASVRPDRDHYFGRIYRIQHDSAKSLEIPDLTQADAAALVKTFLHPNKLTRFTAHRLLMDRNDAASVVPQLTAMANDEKFAPARILALWALQRLGQLPPQTVQSALKSDDLDVRKSALLVVEALGEKNTTDVASMLNDPDARVRLLALRAMASSPLTTEAATSLLAILPKLDDDWSRSTATAAASSNAGPVLEAALAMKGAPSNALLDLAGSLAKTLSEKQDSKALGRVVVATARVSPEARLLALTVLEAAASKLPPVPADEAGLEEALTTLLAPDSGLSACALPYAVAWDKTGNLKPVIAKVINEKLGALIKAKVADSVRTTEIRGLVQARVADARIIPAVFGFVTAPDQLGLDTIAALASTGDAALGKPLVAKLPDLTPVAQTALFDALASRATWANDLLDALESKELKPTLLGPARLSKLRLHPDPAIAKRATKLINELGSGTNPAKDEIIAKLLPEIESKPGDIAKGKVAFATTCSICHKLNGEGKEVGPLLDGIGVHGTNELLIHIIDPSRVVDNEHRTWSIALKDGTFAVGIIARENESSLTLHLPGGISQDVKIADIKSRQDTGLSLMPEGLEALGADTLRDILAYLRGGNSKYRALNLGTAFTTDTLQGLYNSREAKNDTVQPKRYGVVTVEGVPFALPDPSTTPTGGNAIVLKNSEKNNTYAGTMPQRVEIPVGYPIGNLHFLGGVAGWGGGPETHKPAMKVSIEHADGKKQVEELYTGDVFIDYPSGDDVPGSKRADNVVEKHHVRYFALPITDRSPVTKVVLESYLNGISATTLAMTTDNDAPQARKKFVPRQLEELPKSGEKLPATAEPGVIRALLIGGGSSHDFEKFFHQADSATLKAAGKIVTAYTSNAEEAIELLKNADTIVLSANHGTFGTAEFQNALNAFADAGHGVVILHAGTWYNWRNAPDYNRRFLGGGARGHGFGDFEVFNRQPNHPVMQGVPAEFKIHDEQYRVVLDAGTPVEVLAETEPEAATKQAYPSVWVVKDPKTRIIGIGLGHALEAHSNPAYQALLINAVRWTAAK
ncbi:MAG TPA: PVC-type heme-binding CxxCH protein [Chthoniobacter sp.]|nr:PVC-type heme-binding CxxCH protein [Chthoniobacter sp.]